MKFVKLSQKLKKYALNVRSVRLGYAHRGCFFRVIHTKFYWTAKTKIGFIDWL